MTAWSVNVWGDSDDPDYIERVVVDFMDAVEPECGTLNMADRGQIIFDPHSRLAMGDVFSSGNNRERSLSDGRGDEGSEHDERHRQGRERRWWRRREGVRQ